MGAGPGVGTRRRRPAPPPSSERWPEPWSSCFRFRGSLDPAAEKCSRREAGHPRKSTLPPPRGVPPPGGLPRFVDPHQHPGPGLLQRRALPGHELLRAARRIPLPRPGHAPPASPARKRPDTTSRRRSGPGASGHVGLHLEKITPVEAVVGGLHDVPSLRLPGLPRGIPTPGSASGRAPAQSWSGRSPKEGQGEAPPAWKTPLGPSSGPAMSRSSTSPEAVHSLGGEGALQFVGVERQDRVPTRVIPWSPWESKRCTSSVVRFQHPPRKRFSRAHKHGSVGHGAT